MCGIVGNVNFQSTKRKTEFAKALAKLNHRGPDSFGFHQWENEGIGGILGMTRLSIIDLSNASNQPFFSKSKEQCLVYNGEIYNYLELRQDLTKAGCVFETNSDTEVLIQGLIRKGEKFLNECEGMFAFAFVDFTKKILILARDAFGMKPLFFSKIEGQLDFSSEVGSLLALRPQHNHKIDLKRVSLYLEHGIYDHDENTFLEEVKTIKPGHFIKIPLVNSVPNVEQVSWWKPPREKDTSITFDEAKITLRDMILGNLERHIRSDRPVGVSISGGVDSSIIAFSLQHLYPEEKIVTFGYNARNQNFSEKTWIDEVSKQICSLHTNVEYEEDSIEPILSDLIAHQGMPFGSLSILAQWHVYKAYAKNGVTVSLDGQGADELFGGYSGYPEHRIHELLSEKDYRELLKFSKRWSQFPGRNKRELASGIYKYISKQNRSVEAEWYLPNHYLAHVSKFAVQSRNLPALLRHGDRNSMRWSIENRQPFLTTKLAEFSWSLPSEFHVNDRGLTKNILRESFKNIVPNNILFRKDKIGFQAPWLSNSISNTLLSRTEKIVTEREMYIFMNKYRYFFSASTPEYLKWRMINLIMWMDVFDIEY